MFKFEQWMLDAMYEAPLFLPSGKIGVLSPVYEPGASLRLVYADMMEEAGNEEDANYLREIIKYWYADRAAPTLDARIALGHPSKPTPLVVSTVVAWICHTTQHMYLTTDGRWRCHRQIATGETFLCDRSLEVRWRSFSAMQEALLRNPCLYASGYTNTDLILETECIDGKLPRLWNAQYRVTQEGEILRE